MPSENPKDVASEQANDYGLWSVPAEGTQPIAEAMLQTALRRLHAAVEGKHWDGPAGKFEE